MGIHYESHLPGKSLRFVCLEVDCFSVFATQETFREHKADCFLRSRTSEASFDSALEHAQRVLPHEMITQQMVWQQTLYVSMHITDILFYFYRNISTQTTVGEPGSKKEQSTSFKQIAR